MIYPTSTMPTKSFCHKSNSASLELGCAVMLIPFQKQEEQGQPGWRSRRRVTAIGSLMTQTQSQYQGDELANQ